MPRVDLQSTMLQAAAYHGHLASLDLEFRGGAIYRYFGVPAQTYEDLLLAGSKGNYFNHHIRNRFAYTQVQHAVSPSGSRHSSRHDG
jgi:hypothetical protein